ncbi:MAG: ferritin family protein [Armatimonadota bacterium]|nr:ferritin family protein [Armatimonadota bacterium]
MAIDYTAPQNIDLCIMGKSLVLEQMASARYAEHQRLTSDPQIFSLLQGLQRNEELHEKELREHIQRLEGNTEEIVAQCIGPEEPESVAGGPIPGYKTILEILRKDLAVEHQAVRLYAEFSLQASDPDVKKLFAHFARAENGHVNSLGYLMRQIERGNYDVSFFCPVCGWPISFGENPTVGAETRCRMCHVSFKLDMVDSDFAPVEVKL